MPTPNLDKGKLCSDEELRVRQQIAFASGLFQGDITIRTVLESLAEGVVRDEVALGCIGIFPLC